MMKQLYFNQEKTSIFGRIKIVRNRVLLLVFCFTFLLIGLTNDASAAAVGERITFNVDPYYDISGRSSVSATLKQMSEKSYIYIEDNWWNSLTAEQQIAALNSLINVSREFDRVIYPKMTAVFGSEWSPGIDNEVRITILLTKLSEQAGGYFRYFDEYPKSQYSSSNEREMIYLNANEVTNPRFKSFVAHEFQHLITFFQKTKLHNLEEEYWLNEARSEYAPTLLGYDNPYYGSNLEKRVQVFLNKPSDALAEWRNETLDYAVVNLFMQYLVDHYGPAILTAMTQNDKIGIASVEYALRTLGKTETFAEVFTKWAIANYLNNCNLDVFKSYCYLNPNLPFIVLHIQPSASYSLGQGSIELASWIKDWSPRWYKIVSADTKSKMLQINFSGYGSTSDFRIAYILEENNVDKIYLMTVNADQTGTLLIPNFGTVVQSITLIPINTFKKTDFTSNDLNTPFSFRLSTTLNESNLYPNGSLVKLSTGPKVYLIDNGVRRWIPSTEIFEARGYKWENIKIVPYENLITYPETEPVRWPDGSLLKSNNYPAVYIISLGKKRAFASADTFIGLGYRWENIKTISQQELDQYEIGMPVYGMPHPDGTLIKFSDSPNVYLIENSKKRWIPSVEVFLAHGYRFEMVVSVDASFKNTYAEGERVQ